MEGVYMKNKLNRFLHSLRISHEANVRSFAEVWGGFTERDLKSKIVRTALCQSLLGLLLTFTIAFCIGRQGTLPEAFKQLMSAKAYVFLFCFGTGLVLLTILLPFRSMQWIRLIGLEATRFAMGGAALVIGLLAGMFLIFIESGDYQELWICVVSAALMVILIIYCSFGLTFHKA